MIVCTVWANLLLARDFVVVVIKSVVSEHKPLFLILIMFAHA